MCIRDRSRLNQLRKAGKFCDTILVGEDGTEFKVLVSRGSGGHGQLDEVRSRPRETSVLCY